MTMWLQVNRLGKLCSLVNCLDLYFFVDTFCDIGEHASLHRKVGNLYLMQYRSFLKIQMIINLSYLHSASPLIETNSGSSWPNVLFQAAFYLLRFRFRAFLVSCSPTTGGKWSASKTQRQLAADTLSSFRWIQIHSALSGRYRYTEFIQARTIPLSKGGVPTIKMES